MTIHVFYNFEIYELKYAKLKSQLLRIQYACYTLILSDAS